MCTLASRDRSMCTLASRDRSMCTLASRDRSMCTLAFKCLVWLNLWGMELGQGHCTLAQWGHLYKKWFRQTKCIPIVSSHSVAGN